MNIGDHVEAYWNLHRDCLSVRPRGGRVEHLTAVTLTNVRFAVQPAGRDKVIRERRKNVHAFVRGIVTAINDDVAPNPSGMLVRYNPYEAGHFQTPTGAPIHNAETVTIRNRRIIAD